MSKGTFTVGFGDDHGRDGKQPRVVKISRDKPLKKILWNIVTQMQLPTSAPDGSPANYVIISKESGRVLDLDKTLPEQGVKEGDHITASLVVNE